MIVSGIPGVANDSIQLASPARLSNIADRAKGHPSEAQITWPYPYSLLFLVTIPMDMEVEEIEMARSCTAVVNQA